MLYAGGALAPIRLGWFRPPIGNGDHAPPRWNQAFCPSLCGYLVPCGGEVVLAPALTYGPPSSHLLLFSSLPLLSLTPPLIHPLTYSSSHLLPLLLTYSSSHHPFHLLFLSPSSSYYYYTSHLLLLLLTSTPLAYSPSLTHLSSLLSLTSLPISHFRLTHPPSLTARAHGLHPDTSLTLTLTTTYTHTHTHTHPHTHTLHHHTRQPLLVVIYRDKPASRTRPPPAVSSTPSINQSIVHPPPYTHTHISARVSLSRGRRVIVVLCCAVSLLDASRRHTTRLSFRLARRRR